jgi:heat shock protein HspQ
MSKTSVAKFKIGQVIRHRMYAFRGVVFDVDAEFSHSDHAHETVITEARQIKNQPFYYLFAEHDHTPYVAYISEQSLLPDWSAEPVQHPRIDDMFEWDEEGCYRRRDSFVN